MLYYLWYLLGYEDEKSPNEIIENIKKSGYFAIYARELQYAKVIGELKTKITPHDYL